MTSDRVLFSPLRPDFPDRLRPVRASAPPGDLRGASITQLWEPLLSLAAFTVLIIGLAVARFKKTAD